MIHPINDTPADEFKFSPLGPWGPTYRGKAVINEDDNHNLRVTGVGKLIKTEAPYWRWVLWHLWVKWWQRLRKVTDDQT